MEQAPKESNLMHQDTPWPTTVAVIGAAGLIGSGVVENLALSNLCQEIRMIDVRDNLVEAHRIDIAESQAMANVPNAPRLVAGAGEGAVDLVIVAASAPETPSGDRRDFLKANLDLLEKIHHQIERLAGENGIILLLSNPVDVLAEAFHRMSAVEPERIMGYSLNDSVRFRIAIARELGVEPSRVEGTVLGEHGDGQVPLFDSVRLDGEPLELTEAQEHRILEDIKGWFARWSALRPGRSSGWTTPIGVVASLRLLTTGKITPAAIWTGGVPGLGESFISLPARLTSARKVAPALPALGASEWEGLQESARSVSGAIAEAFSHRW